MIKLENINLTGISKLEQIEKVEEEDKEFKDAATDLLIEKTEETCNHAIEEFWDKVQSSLGLLKKLGITADEVMQEYSKHLEKLKDRPRKK